MNFVYEMEYGFYRIVSDRFDFGRLLKYELGWVYYQTEDSELPCASELYEIYLKLIELDGAK